MQGSPGEDPIFPVDLGAASDVVLEEIPDPFVFVRMSLLPVG